MAKIKPNTQTPAKADEEKAGEADSKEETKGETNNKLMSNQSTVGEPPK